MRASHSFENGTALEGDFIRLHEPGSPPLSSVLDEAQATARAPEFRIASQALNLDATLWKNRMIDMYTSAGGVELTRRGTVSISLGGYLGSASREDVLGAFQGIRVGVCFSFAPFDLELAQMVGRIHTNEPAADSDPGQYRWTALGAAYTMKIIPSLPVAIGFNVESRFFSFGGNGPVSAAEDQYIYVTSVEIHLEKLL